MPGAPRKKDCPEGPDPKIKKRYLQLTGMLIWVFTHCRLDLAYPTHLVTRVMHAPSKKHLNYLFHLCKYVKTTMHWNLNFYRDWKMQDAEQMGYIFYVFCDSSFADNKGDMTSTAGYFVFLGPGQGAVCGKSFSPKSPALPSTEAEYVCLSEAARQGMWTKNWLKNSRYSKQWGLK